MRIPKTVIYTTVSVFVLLALFVGGAVAYVWYSGQNTPDSTATAPVADTPKAVFTPSKPSPNAKASASVQMLTSPIAPGENASISIKTVPTAKCTIKVEYDKILSTDSGLVEKKADEFGIVDWTWTVGETVPHGTWPVTVTCVYNDQSAVVQGNLQVGGPAS